MVPLDVRIALSTPWWSWDDGLVRKALWASVLTRLRRQGAERLKANGAAGRAPSEWRDIEFLRREPRTHKRVLGGETNLCVELLLGYASVLGLDVRDCFPDSHTWIAEAAAYLSRYAPGCGPPVSVEQAAVYVRHAVPLVNSRPRTGACIEDYVEQLAVPDRQVVLAVVGAIAPMLQARDPELRPAGGRDGVRG